MDIFQNFLISFVASIFALGVALFIDRQRMPKLEMIASEEANADNKYKRASISLTSSTSGYSYDTSASSEKVAGASYVEERWKFFRIIIKNVPFKGIFYLIQRQTAENCRAKIEFYQNESEKISMQGRWASTPEIPHMPMDAILKRFHPDPVTIPVNEQEILDVLAKCQDDKEAYGWNNEAYFHNWRTPEFRLESIKLK